VCTYYLKHRRRGALLACTYAGAKVGVESSAAAPHMNDGRSSNKGSHTN
jgi:hypothetical protein